MAKLYFMNREFPGDSFEIAEMLESEAFRERLTFHDSWYFLHYCVFRNDMLCSEVSATLRTHLYNLVASLYQHFEELAREGTLKTERLNLIIRELLDVAEYSREFPISLWIYGDETALEFLNERMAPLPHAQQLEHLLQLPHMLRHEQDRLSYRYEAEKVALKRYRNALADYNRRTKKAGQTP